MKESYILLTSSLNTITMDCNCACADTAFHTPLKHHSQDIFYISPQISYQATLPNDHYLVFSPYSPGGPSVLNQATWKRYQKFSTQKHILTEDIDYQLAEQNLLIPDGLEPHLYSDNKAQFTVWLHVTNACNLDCPYCYVRKSSEHLSWDIADSSLRKLVETIKKEGFRSLKIKYAGGEALLHFKLIKKAHILLKHLCQDKNIVLEEVILSNGTFLPDDFTSWLLEENIKLMISLDGIGEAHNRQRPDKKGRGTFFSVEKTLLQRLLPEGITPDISITITQKNAKNIAETVAWVLENKLPFSINFYRPTLASASRKELQLEEETIIKGMLSAYKTIENNLPENPLLNSLLDRVQTQAHTHTCGVGHNYAVITHDGKLAQCQMEIQHPVSSKVKTENLIQAINDGPIKNISVDEKQECNKCTFRYRCTGGCPLETYRVTGRWDVKSPHCNIYKTLYPEALRLEGLRLLKNAGLIDI